MEKKRKKAETARETRKGERKGEGEGRGKEEIKRGNCKKSFWPCTITIDGKREKRRVKKRRLEKRKEKEAQIQRWMRWSRGEK